MITRTHKQRLLPGLAVVVVLLAACGDDDSGGATTAGSTTLPSSATDAVTTTVAPPTTVAATTTAPATSTTVATLEQLAIWPAADVVFTTPEAAAADFVAQVFGAGPVLGEFVGGDQRSGEVEVFATADGATVGAARSTLLLRKLGPADGWFVLAATNELNTITAPDPAADVPAGPVTVEGVGQGFEATIVVNAFLAGAAGSELDQEVAMAGNFGEVLPYSVTLDLSGASSGDVVVVMIRGGTGLESDPGDFSAQAYTIA